MDINGLERNEMTPAMILAKEVFERREVRLNGLITNWPKKNNWAGDIPVCSRQGVYSITSWDKKKLHTTYLQARFEKGKQEEEMLIRELMQLGFEVVETQVPLAKDMMDTYRLSGKIDGKIKFMDRRIPFEVKSMSPYAFDKVASLDDIKNDLFMSRYYRQMQVYLMGHNEPAGVFFLTDCLGHWTIIPVPLDYEESEQILKKVEEINRHVDAGTLPDRIEYDEKICGFCPFSHICLPDVINEKKIQWKDDPALERLLSRRAELEPGASEYDKVDKEIKERLREVPMAVVGDWMITGQWQTRKFYEVPEAIKKNYQKESKAWIMKIKKLSEVSQVQEEVA